MPRVSTVRPGRVVQLFSAVCRLTCSKTGSCRETTDSALPSGPRKSRMTRTTSLRDESACWVACTHSMKPWNARPNRSASSSENPDMPHLPAL